MSNISAIALRHAGGLPGRAGGTIATGPGISDCVLRKQPIVRRSRAHNRCTPGPANLPSRARFAANSPQCASRHLLCVRLSSNPSERYSAVGNLGFRPGIDSAWQPYPRSSRSSAANSPRPAPQIPRPEQRKSPHPPSRSQKLSTYISRIINNLQKLQK